MRVVVFIGVLLALFTQEVFAEDYRRVAVVVGANAAAPGRRALRFAHKDADNVAAVLRLSGVAANDIHVLHDPNPDEVLRTLDTLLTTLSNMKGESLLFFYYSGHADAQALYPNGRKLALNELRTRLDSGKATVRIGIVDACRGGGWTGTKGLSKTKIFEVNMPLQLSNEGSVLISSSSGLEDAHESEALQGSFFTHHWNAGLRGAGDEDQNGVVTLSEAFEYAKSLTIRDTALHTAMPQHPSFQLNLHGQRDLELVTLKASSSLLNVEQQQGPLQVIHLDTGLLILEIPAGKRDLTLAIPQGRYLVRRKEGKNIAAREIYVKGGSTAQVNEAQLEVVGPNRLVTKSYRSRPITQSTLPKGAQSFQAALGVRHGPSLGSGLEVSDFASDSGLTGTLVQTLSITDRLQWGIGTLGFAYRMGAAGHREWIPWGGLIGWKSNQNDAGESRYEGILGLGMDTRFSLSPQSSLNLDVGLGSRFQYVRKSECADVSLCDNEQASWIGPDIGKAHATVGYSRNFDDAMTLNIAFSVSQSRRFKDSGSEDGEDFRLSIGSVQSRALRPLPLLQIHVSDSFTIDGHASISYSSDAAGVADVYMLGGTWTN